MSHHFFSRPLALLIFVVVLLFTISSASASSAGCGKSPITSGTKTTTVNGKARRWIVRVPDGYDKDRPYKLVFGLHWRGGDYQSVDGGTAPYYGLRALANNSAIFVAPDGLNQGWANQGGEDVTFVDEVFKTVRDGLCIDEKLVFSLGFSYGGAMSYSLACSRPSVFRAVAVLSGALLSGCNGGTQPVVWCPVSSPLFPWQGPLFYPFPRLTHILPYPLFSHPP